MNILKKSLWFFAATFTILSCQKEEKEVALKGKVFGSEEILVSEIKPKELVAIDTLVVENQQFELTQQFDAPTFLLLEFSEGVRLPILVEPNKTINMTVNDTNGFGIFEAEGSKSAHRMAVQRKLFVQSMRLSDSLEFLNLKYQDSANYLDHRTEWNKVFVAQIEEHRNALKVLIDEDSTDLANIMAFYQSLGQLELFNPTKDLRYYEKVANGLQAKFPENEHTQYFVAQLENYHKAVEKQERMQAAAQNVVKGSPAPEISLPDLDDKMHNLSDLRGKIVLIDFWASWCGPCRRANPHLVELYKKYQSKDFEIFSVSLDGIQGQANPKNDWRFAIEKDGLVWPHHVSDLKGYDSEVVPLYGFQGIPFTVLVDKEGNIIAKNLRGEALAAKLKEVLGS